jgi:membrane protease YdiL (CAAX protease family)
MSVSERCLRITEFLFVFWALPAAYYFDLLPVHKLIALICVAAVCAYVLTSSPLFSWRHLLIRSQNYLDWKTMLLRTVTVAAVVFILVMLLQPQALLHLPLKFPWMWALLMVLYPLISVLPQEVIYRVYFFERYKRFFGSKWLMVLVSAASFGFMHVVYENWWAVILSFVGGLIFSRTYQQSRSLWWVSLEHAIYGGLIFTLGLGSYFYETL